MFSPRAFPSSNPFFRRDFTVAAEWIPGTPSARSAHHPILLRRSLLIGSDVQHKELLPRNASWKVVRASLIVTACDVRIRHLNFSLCVSQAPRRGRRPMRLLVFFADRNDLGIFGFGPAYFVVRDLIKIKVSFFQGGVGLRDRGKNSCEADNWYRCPCGGNVVRNFIQPSGWRCPLVRSNKHGQAPCTGTANTPHSRRATIWVTYSPVIAAFAI